MVSMRKALLDANFLVLPFQETVDVFEELDRVLGRNQVYTLNRTYNEALDLEDGAYREEVELLVEKKGVEIVAVESEKAADDLLVEMAGEYVICTNDAELRRVMRERQLPHVYLRQGSYLEAENLDTLPF